MRRLSLMLVLAPSQAAEAMEMGAAAVMANTAMATAGDIPLMSEAFKLAVEAGRKGYLAHPGRVLDKKQQHHHRLVVLVNNYV